MISFIKGGMKIRTSYQIYKECQNMLSQGQAATSESFSQFEGGVKLGIGSFNLMLSLLPQRILRLLEFIGFSGNREFGLSQLMEGSANHSLRSILSALTLLFYHTYVSLILGTAPPPPPPPPPPTAPHLLLLLTSSSSSPAPPPPPHLLLLAVSRCERTRVHPQAQSSYEECLGAQHEWLPIHHLCYWELMWCHSYRQQWLEAYKYADLLCRESRWSKAIYVYQKAAILSMMTPEEVEHTGEHLVQLFRKVEGLKQRLAGKSIPTEKFAIRKSRRYNAAQPVSLVLPALDSVSNIWAVCCRLSSASPKSCRINSVSNIWAVCCRLSSASPKSCLAARVKLNSIRTLILRETPAGPRNRTVGGPWTGVDFTKTCAFPTASQTCSSRMRTMRPERRSWRRRGAASKLPPVKGQAGDVCVRSSDCAEGLCCARHFWKRLCKRVLQEGQVCTLQPQRHKLQRPPEIFQRCHCGEELDCRPLRQAPAPAPAPARATAPAPPGSSPHTSALTTSSITCTLSGSHVHAVAPDCEGCGSGGLSVTTSRRSVSAPFLRKKLRKVLDLCSVATEMPETPPWLPNSSPPER
ncbi:hypothetical protein CRUP_029440 [Coryphaenoides rupestris]|nr:hypothetical protein CRUP_029440 [Coryphaenoides rupestris]